MLMWIHLNIIVILTMVADKLTYSEPDVDDYYQTCPTGCARCSVINGCVSCDKDYYMLLQRTGMKQIGVCLPACPRAFYGVNRKGYRRCLRCRVPKCIRCHHKHHCVECDSPYSLYNGICVERCPEGMLFQNITGKCSHKVNCGVGEWGTWRACARNGQTCGFKYGIQTRSRDIVQHPSKTGKRCPILIENKRCRMRMRQCVDLVGNNSEPDDSKSKWSRRNGRRKGKKHTWRWKRKMMRQRSLNQN